MLLPIAKAFDECRLLGSQHLRCNPPQPLSPRRPLPSPASPSPTAPTTLQARPLRYKRLVLRPLLLPLHQLGMAHDPPLGSIFLVLVWAPLTCQLAQLAPLHRQRLRNLLRLLY